MKIFESSKCKGVSNRKQMQKDSWETEASVQLRALLALHRPRLKRDVQDHQGHDEGREAHADGEGEHGVQVVKLHGFDHVAGLSGVG